MTESKDLAAKLAQLSQLQQTCAATVAQQDWDACASLYQQRISLLQQLAEQCAQAGYPPEHSYIHQLNASLHSLQQDMAEIAALHRSTSAELQSLQQQGKAASAYHTTKRLRT